MQTENSHGRAHISAGMVSGPEAPLTLTREQEREALRRVLEHPEISRSASLVRFLGYICNKYFEGQTDEIREYSIAVDALGRREGSFDSRVDPIVRVTARALRKKLSDYYAGDGREDAVRIHLPLGHYVPQFLPNHAAGPDVQVVEEIEEVSEVSEQSAAMPVAIHKRWPGIWKAGAAGLALAAVFAVGYFAGRRSEGPTVLTSRPVQWGDPVWSDEFDGPAMQAPDPGKWSFDVGGGGWGAKQLQTYCSPAGGGPKECTPRHPNAFLDGEGHLILRAEKSADGVWTSARIHSQGHREFQYGRIEVRMKMPVGKALWPSVWMLGSNFSTAGWPASGSFDFVENVSLNSGSNGLGPGMIRSTIHGPHYYGANGLWHDFRLLNGGRVDDGGFHNYGVIWSPGMIQFYVDDPANVYFVANSSEIPDGGQWVFDHPFFLLMNLAIGGDWPGDPDATTPNPADLVIDYVRQYRIPPLAAPSIQWQPVDVKAGSSLASNVTLKAGGYVGRVHLSCSTEPSTAVCSLATPVVNFSDTLTQQDTLTITTDSFGNNGRVMAPAGHYKVTITATSMSGESARVVAPFDVMSSRSRCSWFSEQWRVARRC